jgi:predicted  nucleic acid-binding Zn-ribbon protein
MKIEEFERLKRRVDDANETAARAAGAASELKKRLKREFGVDSVTAARAELKKMETAAAELERKFQSTLTKFERDYSDECK